jgi:cysteine desulfurase / selenocysteine lyase
MLKSVVISLVNQRVSVDWAAVRSEFPALANWTFLNTATFGQLPKCAEEAVTAHFNHRNETACTDFLSWFDDADRIRASLARLVHCAATDIAFVPNASTALGLMISGIQWKPGDRIVSIQDEFPNNLYFPAHLAARGVEFVETPWESFYSALDDRTRLVLMSTVKYSTGLRPPLEEVSREVHRHGALFYVDGTQSVGALEFRVPDVKPDMLAVHGYKWLLSPNGAGFMYVSPALRQQLQPTVIGWRSDRRWREVDQLHHGAPEFVDAAEKYEGGMLNFPSVYAMGASVDLLLSLGPALIEERVMELIAQCTAILEGAGASIAHRNSPIMAARFPGHDAPGLSAALKKRRILTAARHGNLRVSVHFYNDSSDLERLQHALREII